MGEGQPLCTLILAGRGGRVGEVRRLIDVDMEVSILEHCPMGKEEKRMASPEGQMENI